jgi:hypothetical protein
MKGQETAPINEHNLAALLGLIDMPYNVILGKPKKDNKSAKAKTFSKRVQKKQ